MAITVDDYVSFDVNPATGGEGGDFEQYNVPSGWYYLVLKKMEAPFQQPDFNDPTKMITKSKFMFEIYGSYDLQGGIITNTGVEGKLVSINVSIEARSEKSVKYLIAKAITGRDFAHDGTPAPKPSELIGGPCWAEVERKPGKRDPNKSYSNIRWDSFCTDIPQSVLEQARAVVARMGGGNNVPAAQQPANVRTLPQRPAVAQATPQPALPPKRQPPF